MEKEVIAENRVDITQIFASFDASTATTWFYSHGCISEGQKQIADSKGTPLQQGDCLVTFLINVDSGFQRLMEYLTKQNFVAIRRRLQRALENKQHAAREVIDLPSDIKNMDLHQFKMHTKQINDVKQLMQLRELKMMRTILADYYLKRFHHLVPIAPDSNKGANVEDVWVNLQWHDNSSRSMKTDSNYLHFLSVFVPGEPALVVVKGEAGSGKSTFVRKLAYDWAKCGVEWLKSDFAIHERTQWKCLENVFLLVVMLLRNPKGKGKLAEFVMQHLKEHIFNNCKPYDYEKMCYAFERLVELCPTSVLFVLDGWDEFANKAHCKELYNQIECETGEPPQLKYNVLITSRPHAVERITNSDYTTTVLGFLSKDAEEFCKKYFVSKGFEEEVGVHFWKEISVDEGFATILCNPLMLTMTCYLKYLFIEGKDRKLSNRKTTIYMQMIECLIDAYKRKHNTPDDVFHDDNQASMSSEGPAQRKRLISALSLSDDHKHRDWTKEEKYIKLGRLALNKLLKGSGVLQFAEHEVKEFLGVDADEVAHLGVLRVDPECLEFYEFLHKSFQEFFAALYLAQIANHVVEDDQGDLKMFLKNIEDSPRRLFDDCMTISFFMGLLNNATVLVNSIKESFKNDITKVQYYVNSLRKIVDECSSTNKSSKKKLEKFFTKSLLQSLLDNQVTFIANSLRFSCSIPAALDRFWVDEDKGVVLQPIPFEEHLGHFVVLRRAEDQSDDSSELIYLLYSNDHVAPNLPSTIQRCNGEIKSFFFDGSDSSQFVTIIQSFKQASKRPGALGLKIGQKLIENCLEMNKAAWPVEGFTISCADFIMLLERYHTELSTILQRLYDVLDHASLISLRIIGPEPITGDAVNLGGTFKLTFQSMAQLTHLGLCNLMLCPADVQCIVAAFEHMHCLMELDLNNNTIDKTTDGTTLPGGRRLAKNLTCALLPALSVLKLGNNHLGPESVRDVIKMFAQIPSASFLALSYNVSLSEYTPFATLCSTLPKWRNCEKLAIQNCDLDADQVEDLLDVLMATTVAEVWLDRNTTNDEGITKKANEVELHIKSKRKDGKCKIYL